MNSNTKKKAILFLFLLFLQAMVFSAKESVYNITIDSKTVDDDIKIKAECSSTFNLEVKKVIHLELGTDSISNLTKTSFACNTDFVSLGKLSKTGKFRIKLACANPVTCNSNYYSSFYVGEPKKESVVPDQNISTIAFVLLLVVLFLNKKHLKKT